MQRRSGHRCWVASTLALATALLSACGSIGSQESAADDAARTFYAAVTASQWDSACALLMPSTLDELELDADASCADALSKEDLPPAGDVRRAQVWGTMAQVELENDVVFLANAGAGWRITAAGCTFRAENLPYTLPSEGRLSVKAAFWTCLVFVAVGLAYFLVIGLLQR